MVAAPAANAASLGDAVSDLSQQMAPLEEDIDDLEEPIDEFEQFDQRMFLLRVGSFGASSADGRVPFSARGRRTYRPLLALDLRGFGAAQFSFLAFPGEEPPQIECNEDAGSGDDDDE